MNLVEGLHNEIVTARDRLKLYEEIPTGAFGAAFLKVDIATAERALASGDVIEMVRAYQNLKGSNED